MELSTRKRWAGPRAGTVPDPPAEFDEYRLLRPLRVGGDSRVYLAQDTLLDRLVAVKFVPAPDRRSLERFLAEARAAARIQHPNIATLYRVGQSAGAAYLVSEYVRGRALTTVERPLASARALEIACDLARGLGAAHRRGVLHCDLSLGNVLLTEDDQIKIVDFGLARLLLPVSATEEQPERPLFGTADHIPPEAWRGEELTVRSDLYSLGVIAFDLCAGRPPFHDVPPHLVGHAVAERDAPALGALVPGIHPGFAAAVDRCLRRDPKERFATADDLLDAFERARPGRRIAVPEGNPYRGLQAFQPEHRAVFFGRSRDCLAVVERLRSEPFVLVAGDSGVGKSSLCLAGVVPAVGDGALGPRTFKVARLVPGRRPLAALANALAPQGMDDAEHLLRDDPAGFARMVSREAGEDGGVVVFVDQLEELVTIGREEAPAVAAALAELCAGYDGIRLLATVRNDFLGPIAALPGLGELAPRALYLLRGLSEEDLREAIAGPAAANGFRFESEALVSELANATSTAPGGLPLLQFMLSQVWEARDRERGVIAAAGIQALGGVGGALARHADLVLGALVPEEREAARRILLRLATPQLTRTRHDRDDLTGRDRAAQSALEALVRGRLLVVHEGTVELAHEALLTAWGTLARWVEAESGQETVRHRVETAAAEWVGSGRDREALWGPHRIAEARAVDARTLSPMAREFVAKSEMAIGSAARRRRVFLLATACAIAAIVAGVRALQKREVDANVASRLAEATTALEAARTEAAALQAARADSFREFDAGRKQAGEDAWQRALAIRARVATAFAQTAEKFEDALLLGGDRADVRAAFADFLAARAAQEDRRPEREELLQRLRLYDPSGARMRAFRGDSTLSLTTAPAGAAIRIAPIVESEGRRVPGPPRDLGTSPLPALRLEPGTYRLSVAVAGRDAIEVPLQLDPGEQRRIDLEIPPAGAIPAGYVYVPEGRAWFGTSADESVRQFFNTAPLHRIATGAFLIARTETTWADWIEYLRALPARERKLRSPHAGGGALSGQLDLRDHGGTFSLALQTGSHLQILREGEKIHLPRSERADQDWLRLPVAGVSFQDARAYAAWLSHSGRVPGARLCNELEWERAARGADDREFPSGETLGPRDANFDATYGKEARSFGLDEVGAHPRSESPFGVEDMAGNVWEWVDSALTPGEAVARGGSAFATRDTCRSVNRETPEPSFRAAVLGVRICASYPSRTVGDAR